MLAEKKKTTSKPSCRTSKRSVLWADLCPQSSEYADVLTLNIQNVTVFGDPDFKRKLS